MFLPIRAAEENFVLWYQQRLSRCRKKRKEKICCFVSCIWEVQNENRLARTLVLNKIIILLNKWLLSFFKWTVQQKKKKKVLHHWITLMSPIWLSFFLWNSVIYIYNCLICSFLFSKWTITNVNHVNVNHMASKDLEHFFFFFESQIDLELHEGIKWGHNLDIPL